MPKTKNGKKRTTKPKNKIKRIVEKKPLKTIYHYVATT